MGIIGDRYESTFEGHRIELVRDNLAKTLALVIDGAVVASESRTLPHEIELVGALEHEGVNHTVIARSTVKSVLGLPLDADDQIEIDGKPVPLQRTR
jgi:hypothetical protein